MLCAPCFSSAVAGLLLCVCVCVCVPFSFLRKCSGERKKEKKMKFKKIKHSGAHDTITVRIGRQGSTAVTLISHVFLSVFVFCLHYVRGGLTSFSFESAEAFSLKNKKNKKISGLHRALPRWSFILLVNFYLFHSHVSRGP